MPSAFPPCPDCQSPYTYQDLEKLLCPECGHEWQLDDVEHAEHEPVVRDSNGNQLNDGDYVTLIKNFESEGNFVCRQNRYQSENQSTCRWRSQH